MSEYNRAKCILTSTPYFNIFIISDVHKPSIQINSILAPADQFNTAQHFPQSLQSHLFVFGVGQSCAFMRISLAAALPLSHLIYDSSIVIIALFLPHKPENAVCFHPG